MIRSKQNTPALLEISDLDLLAPGGRTLIQKLNLRVGREQAAIIGRNGVGKSTLLRLISGQEQPARGQVSRRTTPWLVSQRLQPLLLADEVERILANRSPQAREAFLTELGEAGLVSPFGRHPGSPGELRKLHLLEAKLRRPQFLILDEPTQDLDERGVDWLIRWLSEWEGALLVVSHHRELLRRFEHFLIIAESGCRYLPGTLRDLEATLAQEEADNQRRYVRRLNALEQSEAHSEKYRRRRERKKNRGRVRELGRATPRIRLNQKRSHAQVKQGRIEGIRQKRIDAARSWAKAARRALAVTLPLQAVMPDLPPPSAEALLTLESVAAHVDGRTLFQNLSLQVSRERIAITGPNGSGKTTLLRILAGDQAPSTGLAQRRKDKIGFIDQGAMNWLSEESLLERLAWSTAVPSVDAAAGLLIAHGFPLALAERPLLSLSPGERVRAALICMLQQRPAPELLLLDEPTYALDFAGVHALREVLRAWPGGLVVASHDHEFLDSIEPGRRIELGSTE